MAKEANSGNSAQGAEATQEKVQTLTAQIEAKIKMYEILAGVDQTEADEFHTKMIAPLQRELVKLQFSGVREQVNTAFTTSAQKAAPAIVEKAQLTSDQRLTVTIDILADGTVKVDTRLIDSSRAPSAGGGRRGTSKKRIVIAGTEYPSGAEGARAFFALHPEHPDASKMGQSINWVKKLEVYSKTHSKDVVVEDVVDSDEN